MIFRDANNMGTGSVSATNIRIGVSSTLPYDIEVRGYAIEMAVIPAPVGHVPYLAMVMVLGIRQCSSFR
ncbi:MAG: hypothetical protein IPP46_20080 [Bacteroidetes bacterium]|nr:hypothetical protein [Bacteroidota bacterium]